MTSDHEFLVRRDDPRRNPAVAPADARSPGLVGRLVQLDAEPCGIAADPCSDRGGVLANSRGEHQRVEPAQGRGQRAQLAADAVDIEVDRLGGPGSVLASSVLMSLEMPETPRSPDSLYNIASIARASRCR